MCLGCTPTFFCLRSLETPTRQGLWHSILCQYPYFVSGFENANLDMGKFVPVRASGSYNQGTSFQNLEVQKVPEILPSGDFMLRSPTWRHKLHTGLHTSL
ncbi:uncharacterized protein H6S33_012848 [Morchella sextelata]|uniref:uncharacterized protein n=1 Tax=Morchella sextelata TaxID=1174677 RepID=UPI001D047FB9|nr:uncharacterized protein H6S33_012848 [Morchella sextelata]KAH0609362.1 hypothetical protein H6S33_012848 [Morchella sextelata]